MSVPLHSFCPQHYWGGEIDGRWFALLEKNNLSKIRKDVEDCVGKKVILKANKGRKKTTIREGILEEAYPSLFVVKISNQYDSVRRVSYTYSDILTETVEVTICDDEERKIKIS